jgi:mRNA interferase MazF
MARELNRGEIWLYTFRPPDKRRPVLVLTRQEVIPLLNTVIVAPEGLKRESAVNLDHVQTVEKTRLRRFLGSLSRERMTEVCQALARATGCAS